MPRLADDPRVLVHGVGLTYRRIAPPWVTAACPLVFLHEGLGSITQWRDFPSAVAHRTGRAALVYNRQGHGTSDPLEGPRPVTFMHHEGEVVLPALLDALGVERAVLVGHSDGASIALLAAAVHPDRVEALVLEAPHVFVEDLSVTSIAAIRTVFETTDLRQRLARHHGANTEAMFRGWNDIWLAPAFRAWNIERCLPGVRCPVLVVQGRDDEYGTPAQVDAIRRQVAGPCETVLLEACGHAPHLDQRTLTEDHVVRFLTREPVE